MKIAVAILAGGQSRRMGRDKASLRVGGATLLARTNSLAAAVVGPGRVAIIGRERPADWAEDATTFLPDDHPGDGPLPAIAAALRWAATVDCEQIIVLPCDLPQLTADALRWLFEVAETGPITGDGIAVQNADGVIEPLFSVYAKPCLAAIAAQMATGRRSPMALIENGDFGRVDAPPFVCQAIADVDTPEDWAAFGTNSGYKP